MDESTRRAIVRQFSSIMNQARDLINKLHDIESTRIGTTFFQSRIDLNRAEENATIEAGSLLNLYATIRPEAEAAFGIKLMDVSEHMDDVLMSANLRALILECEKLIGYAEETSISSTDINRLDDLKKELSEASEGLSPHFETNLEEAIIEAEKGHSLASVLIAGRVVSLIYTEIKNKVIEVEGKASDTGKKIEPKEILDFLVTNSFIDKSRKDIIESVLITIKQSRDIFSHSIDVYAKPTDVLPLLSGAVKLVGIYKKFREKTTFHN